MASKRRRVVTDVLCRDVLRLVAANLEPWHAMRLALVSPHHFECVAQDVDYWFRVISLMFDCNATRDRNCARLYRRFHHDVAGCRLSRALCRGGVFNGGAHYKQSLIFVRAVQRDERGVAVRLMYYDMLQEHKPIAVRHARRNPPDHWLTEHGAALTNAEWAALSTHDRDSMCVEFHEPRFDPDGVMTVV